MATVTASSTPLTLSAAKQELALTYQQNLLGQLHTLIVTPEADGIVLVQPGQLTVVRMQMGRHLTVRRGVVGEESEVPDNLIAVRHADALHVRYADGSAAHFEDFFSQCTNDTACSVNLAGDQPVGFDLSGFNAPSGI